MSIPCNSQISDELGLPDNDSALVWRYMDVVKFESLLKEKSLYFASARQLGDEHEGSLTDEELKAMFDMDFSQVTEQEFYTLKKFYKNFRFGGSSVWEPLRDYVKINCWHLNEHESYAMWNLYAGQSRGIAIQTTISKLLQSIYQYKIKPDYESEKISIGRVKYVNFSKENRGLFLSDKARFLYKKNSYSSENEIRLLVSLRLAAEYGVDIPIDGIFVPVNLKELISKVYISPYFDQQDENYVNNIMKKYGYDFEIVHSELRSGSVY